MLNEINSTFSERRATAQAEIDQIDQEEEAAKAKMRADTIAQIQALLVYLSIRPDEVKFTTTRALTPKFINPEAGETWHGVGKRPAWLKDKNIENYRIKPTPSAD